MRLLAAGVVLFALDGVAAALIDSAGRSARNALLALADLALYIPLLLALLAIAGITGAALAWALRALLTLVARLALAGHAVPGLRRDLQVLAPALAACIATLAGALALATSLPPETGWPRLALALALPLPCAWLTWRHGLLPAERLALGGRLRRVVAARRLR